MRPGERVPGLQGGNIFPLFGNASLDQLPGSLAAARSTLGHLADTADLGGRDRAPDSGQPVNHGPKVPTGLLQPGQSSDGGVTGLNPRQESGALGFLLGGER